MTFDEVKRFSRWRLTSCALLISHNAVPEIMTSHPFFTKWSSVTHRAGQFAEEFSTALPSILQYGFPGFSASVSNLLKGAWQLSPAHKIEQHLLLILFSSVTTYWSGFPHKKSPKRSRKPKKSVDFCRTDLVLYLTPLTRDWATFVAYLTSQLVLVWRLNKEARYSRKTFTRI